MSSLANKRRSTAKSRRKQKIKQKNVEKIDENFQMFLEISSDNNEIIEDSKKIVVPADAFNNFEDLRLNRKSESSCSSFENKSEMTDNKTNDNNSKTFENKEINPKIVESNENNSKTKENIEINSKTKENIEIHIENNGETSENTNKNDSDVSDGPEKCKTNFESVFIKNEISDSIDNHNSLKIPDKKDNSSKEGEPPSRSTFLENFSPSVVNNRRSDSQPTKNSVFVIKNLAGKKVTIIPKSTPVVLNKSESKPVVQNSNISANKTKTVYVNQKLTLNQPQIVNNCEILDDKSVVLNKTIKTLMPKLRAGSPDIKQENIDNKFVVNKIGPLKQEPDVKPAVDQKKFTAIRIKNKNIKILRPLVPNPAKCKNLIKILPNSQVMHITEFNKSQNYFGGPKLISNPAISNFTIEKSESLSEKYTEVSRRLSEGKASESIAFPDQKGMKNNLEFSKILQALTESSGRGNSSKNLNLEAKIPIYVDNTTQTEILTTFKDQSVQTETYQPVSPIADCPEPDITNLLEYVLSVPEYSSGLDESKKNDLIGLSKNIVFKEKIMPEAPRTEVSLKKQLFMDLRECLTFDFLGYMPIHNAVLENNLKSLKRQIFALTLRKMSVDVGTNQGLTALQLAVSNNCNVELISTLLISGASVNILDNEGNSLIHLAVLNSNHVVLELLIKYLNNTVRELNRKNDEGLTALMMAAIDSKPEMVDMLLRNKADPNLRDEKSGRTALFHAVELNSNLVINLLLKYRADPKIRNYFGLTALDAAKDLDMQDSKVLESEKEAASQRNHSSAVVNMVINGKDKKINQYGPAKRRQPQKRREEEEQKKLKFDIVSSLRKVEFKVKTSPKPFTYLKRDRKNNQETNT